jgi:VanZ family protein
VRKKIYFYSAIFWSGLILYLCLENADNLKEITIPNFDKVIHIVFHFVFTILWFLYLKKKLNSLNNFKTLSMALVLSFIFGIIIEVLQEFFTTTRSADIFDILSNVLGSLLGVILINLLNRNNKILDKI